MHLMSRLTAPGNLLAGITAPAEFICPAGKKKPLSRPPTPPEKNLLLALSVIK